MITSSDREYKQTKRIKQGKKMLKAPFDELADWISKTRDVTVLNVVYDRANSIHAPRLQVILEHEGQVSEFRKGINFDQRKQNAVKKKFLSIIESEDHGFDVEGLFVVFSAFAPIAKQDADRQITEEEISALKNRIANPDLWEISRCFGFVTFFFHTDAQKEKYEELGRKKEYASMYFDVLKQCDEFGYLTRSRYKVSFDSKENFDKNYNSNWFNYYR